MMEIQLAGVYTSRKDSTVLYVRRIHRVLRGHKTIQMKNSGAGSLDIPQNVSTLANPVNPPPFRGQFGPLLLVRFSCRHHPR